MSDDKLKEVIRQLTDRLGRMPTEDEVYDFTMGDEDVRTKIWNKEVK